MTVTVHHSAGTTTGRLDAWDERGCVVDGRRIDGPVAVVVLRDTSCTAILCEIREGLS